MELLLALRAQTLNVLPQSSTNYQFFPLISEFNATYLSPLNLIAQ
jgi:hypothetical protein